MNLSDIITFIDIKYIEIRSDLCLSQNKVRVLLEIFFRIIRIKYFFSTSRFSFAKVSQNLAKI